MRECGIDRKKISKLKYKQSKSVHKTQPRGAKD